jgi:CDP-diacylglycerol--serine O-phosphatidyltransferase
MAIGGPGPSGRSGVSDTASRRRGAFRLKSHSGARVVRPERLSPANRAKAMLPSVFTLTNMLCGFSSLRAAQLGRFQLAAVLIGIAVVCDILDGAAARAVRAITPFGLQFDSLADLISFGVAPAMLLYSWSLHDLNSVGWALSCFWLACAAYRLGRFNVTVDPMADKRYFIGLPSPGAAGVVMASVFAAHEGFDGDHDYLAVLITVIPAALMATSFRFRSFRSLVSPRRDRIWVSLLAIAVLTAGFVVRPAITGLVVAYGYVALAPLGWITRPLRLRLFGADSVAPPRHHYPSVFFLLPDAASVDDAEEADELAGTCGDETFSDAEVLVDDDPDEVSSSS